MKKLNAPNYRYRDACDICDYSGKFHDNGQKGECSHEDHPGPITTFFVCDDFKNED
jgi:hypothetical protein